MNLIYALNLQSILSNIGILYRLFWCKKHENYDVLRMPFNDIYHFTVIGNLMC